MAFLDSDDFWPKEKLNLQIKDMIKNDLDFTFTDISYFKDSTIKKLNFLTFMILIILF